MAQKVTAPGIRAMRAQGQKIVCVTAYDSTFGAIADAAGVDVVLVGDSVGNVMLGYDSTLPVDLEDMVRHTRATRAGVERALLVADLPFGSYQSSVEQAVDSAVALMKAGAEAVKLEGDYTEAVRAIVRAGIPVMGHVGMTPQSVNTFGGHRVQGRGDAGETVAQVAIALEGAGAFSVVLELVPARLAAAITGRLGIATIGIGAGAGCDGQIQVLHDLLGLGTARFKHAKAFADLRSTSLSALEAYTSQVRDGAFPAEENSFE